MVQSFAFDGRPNDSILMLSLHCIKSRQSLQSKVWVLSSVALEILKMDKRVYPLITCLLPRFLCM